MLLAALCVSEAVSAEPAAREVGAPQVIGAPHYGDTLFNFYQDKTFAALTGLMVSQHFQRIAPHDEEAEVLRGGMLLAYGLHNEAATVFAALIERNAAPAVRDRAWFYLAKVRHKRGLFPQAEEALARIAAPLAGTLEEDRQLLLGQLLMAREDWTGAAAVLDALQAQPKASPGVANYARFNLGVALIKTGEADNTERGNKLLNALGEATAPSEELRSLRDRANVALGFTALAAKQPREARLALQRVRLNGQQSNKALLGFGWAAAELNDPKLALVPWTELASRGGIGEGDAAVLESRIAVPYALAELGAFSGALQGYQDAASGFEQEQKALNESIAAIRAGKLVQGLVSENPSEGLAAFAGITSLPEMPHASHLVPLLAGNEFQEAFKNLRDLQFLDGNLQGWQDNLGAFTDMLDNRRRAFAEKLPAVTASKHADAITALRQRRDALAAEVARAEAESDAGVYASTRERALQERIDKGSATLAKADAADPDIASAAERLRRAAGALLWQQTQEFAARQWNAKKGLRDSENALEQAGTLDTALSQAQRDEPARHEAFATRIGELQRRLLGLRPVVAALSAEQQAELQDVAVAELQRQQERLAVYEAQARLAIAQINDRAQFARRPEAGEAPK